MTQSIDALRLISWQRCRREWALRPDWLPIRWRPKSLFDKCLRDAVATLSSGPRAAAAVATTARAQFFAAAARPGLDLPGNEVYPAAKEWGAILETIIRSIARLSLLVLRPVNPIPLTHNLTWQPLALGADESGTLHRWISVERWDDAAMAREMHGWTVIGDIAMAREPLQLHVVVLGPMRDGHHHSAWGRRFLHPAKPLHIRPRFRSPLGKPLKGWDAQFLADLAGTAADPEEWTRQMWAEGAVEGLLHHPVVACPPDAVLDDIRQQITAEAEAMQWASSEGREWRDWPMTRGACDGLVPCPYRYACYSENIIDLETTGLYLRREREVKAAVVGRSR